MSKENIFGLNYIPHSPLYCCDYWLTIDCRPPELNWSRICRLEWWIDWIECPNLKIFCQCCWKAMASLFSGTWSTWWWWLFSRSKFESSSGAFPLSGTLFHFKGTTLPGLHPPLSIIPRTWIATTLLSLSTLVYWFDQKSIVIESRANILKQWHCVGARIMPAWARTGAQVWQDSSMACHQQQQYLMQFGWFNSGKRPFD